MFTSKSLITKELKVTVDPESWRVPSKVTYSVEEIDTLELEI